MHTVLTNSTDNIVTKLMTIHRFSFKTFTEILKKYNKFGIVGLAETNVGPELSSLYQIAGYNSFHQNTFSDKFKGAGVALCIS